MAKRANPSGHFSIAHTIRDCPCLPYQQMKNDILGTSYCLSLVFVGSNRAQTLNRLNRKKDYVPNVLSFPLDKNHGEIFITPKVAEKKARQRGMTTIGYIGFLFIHALLHLKGMSHGDTMDRLERKYCTKYNLA
jgi:rRNA maturation RNase YbeY